MVTSPYQLRVHAVEQASLGRIAGVHSTVWILAMTAALTSRAVWKSASSSQSG